MSAPIRSTDDILAALREHPEWRRAVWNAFLADEREAEEIRKKLLTDDLLKLPSQLDKTEEERKESQKKVWEAIRETNGTLKTFMESTQAFQRSMEEFRRSMEAFKRSMEAFKRSMEEFKDATERRLAGIETKLDEMDGKVTQQDAVEKLDNYLHRQIDPVEVLERRLLSRILATAEKAGAISEEQREQIGDADALAVGEDKQTGEPACAAAEISTTVNAEDVDRADRRAKLFLKAVRAAIAAKPKQWEKLFPTPPSKSYAFVVGRRITDEASQEAERKGVVFARYRNGYDRQGR